MSSSKEAESASSDPTSDSIASADVASDAIVPVAGPVLETIIAVDPGRAKCGVAVVTGPDPVRCIHRAVVETTRLVVDLAALMRRFPGVKTIIIGAGTGSAPLRRALRSTFTGLTVTPVDEHGSSERARARFLKENVPAGWRRLIPAGLRTPEIPYDDYVAIILAEEWFSEKMGNILPKP